MSEYRKCPNCGAYLDSGETCDCEEMPDKMREERKKDHDKK